MFEKILNSLPKIIELLIPIIIKLIYLLSSIFILIGLIYGFIRFVEFIAKKEVHKPDTIKKLTELISPILLFDSKEVILSDHGAMDYIKNFSIELDKSNNHTPTKIIFNFKKHIQIPPLIESIDMFRFQITTEKSKLNTWIFNLSPIETCDEIDSYKFKLEILK